MLLKRILLPSIFSYFSIACSQKNDITDTNFSIKNLQSDSITAVYEEDEDIKISKDNIWKLVHQKANWFKRDNNPTIDLDLIPNNFLSFYNLFISDSLYQMNHIHFDKLIGVIGECDTTIIFNSNNWEYTNWNFMKFFSIDNNPNNIDGWNNTFYSNKDIFYYEFELNESGVIYQVGFELIDEKWFLTLYYVNAC